MGGIKGAHKDGVQYLLIGQLRIVAEDNHIHTPVALHPLLGVVIGNGMIFPVSDGEQLFGIKFALQFKIGGHVGGALTGKFPVGDVLIVALGIGGVAVDVHGHNLFLHALQAAAQKLQEGFGGNL